MGRIGRFSPTSARSSRAFTSVSTARALDCDRMWRTRSAGPAGSMGTYAAPTCNTAKMPVIASTERDSAVATRSPTPMPRADRAAAVR